MEVVLLWLDDLEDVVFAATFLSERICRICLQYGFLAAVMLQVSLWWSASPSGSLALAAIALSGVGGWLVGRLVSTYSSSRHRNVTTTA